jgi:hypothetical protein
VTWFLFFNVQTIARQYRKLLAFNAVMCPLNTIDCSHYFASIDTNEDSAEDQFSSTDED